MEGCGRVNRTSGHERIRTGREEKRGSGTGGKTGCVFSDRTDKKQRNNRKNGSACERMSERREGETKKKSESESERKKERERGRRNEHEK